MVKTCAINGCDEPIQEWQTYCVDHYVQMNKESAQQPQPVKKKQSVKQVQPQQQSQQPQPTQEVMQKTYNLPNINDRDRLIVKQVAFKALIELMQQMDFFDLDDDAQLNLLRKYTVMFYKVIVEENENADI